MSSSSGKFRYDAFISYSHAADSQLAPAIQKLLEKTGRPWYRYRGLNVYRDVTNLSAAPHAWESIEKALSESRFLVLLASPEAVASKWVKRETEYWLKHKSHDTMVIVLTSGCIVWNDAINDFNGELTTSLPPTLLGKFPGEPLWVDLTKIGSSAEMRSNPGLMQDAVYTIAGAVHGLTKEQLFGRESRFKNVFRAVTAGVILSLLALATLFYSQFLYAKSQEENVRRQRDTAYANELRAEYNEKLADASAKDATRQKDIAEAQRKEAERQLIIAQSNELAIMAMNNELRYDKITSAEFDGTRVIETMNMALTSYRMHPNTEARRILEKYLLTVILQPASARTIPDYVTKFCSPPRNMLVAARFANGNLLIYEQYSKREMWEKEKYIFDIVAEPGDSYRFAVAVLDQKTNERSIQFISYSGLSYTGDKIPTPGLSPQDLQYSADGKKIFFTSRNENFEEDLYMLDIASGKYSLEMNSITDYAVSKKNNFIAVVNDNIVAGFLFDDRIQPDTVRKHPEKLYALTWIAMDDQDNIAVGSVASVYFNEKSPYPGYASTNFNHNATITNFAFRSGSSMIFSTSRGNTWRRGYDFIGCTQIQNRDTAYWRIVHPGIVWKLHQWYWNTLLTSTDNKLYTWSITPAQTNYDQQVVQMKAMNDSAFIAFAEKRLGVFYEDKQLMK